MKKGNQSVLIWFFNKDGCDLLLKKRIENFDTAYLCLTRGRSN
jgi:hypothetical protein